VESYSIFANFDRWFFGSSDAESRIRFCAQRPVHPARGNCQQDICFSTATFVIIGV